MAEATVVTAQPTPATADVVVVPAEPTAEKTADKSPPPPEAEKETKSTTVEAILAVPEPEKKPVSAAEETVPQSGSFKEESNRVADLAEQEKKALEELKQLLKTAVENHELTPPPPPPATEEKPHTKPVTEEGPVTEEQPKAEEPPVSDDNPPATSEEKPPERETVEVVEETISTTTSAVVTVDDDGAKTVEAIEESVVAVTVQASASVAAAEAGEKGEEAPAEKAADAGAGAAEEAEEVLIWGVPLLGDDERSDVVLLKFLRARDFKVKEAMTMIKNTIKWRKEFGIEGLLGEELGMKELEKVVFMSGHDKEGHPVCYNVYGEFQNKELYAKTFSDEEKRQRFLRWRIQLLEKGIRQLDFTPTGICTLVQVTDLKNSPGPQKKELRQATNQALSLLQDNYPEFVAKQIFINVPWWYLAFNRMISPFLTQRTKSKFIFAGPSKSTETLFKYIAPEQVPVQYGGLSKENDPDFTTADAVTEVTIKPATKHIVELPVSEVCTLVWELRVLGWDVNYCAEFVPSAEDGYTVIVQKLRKIASTDEPVIKNSFKVGEPGTIVLTIDNTASKKKKLLYRSKTRSYSDTI